MTTYNTGNPVGSSDPRDLYDNAENLDSLVNGDQAAYNDRLGKSRKSWQGMEDEFAAFIASSGYEFVGDYADGIEITGYQQVVRDINGEFWRLSGSVDLPYTTTGAGMPEGGAFVSVGDAVLRQDLANPDKGAAMVARAPISVDSIADLLELPQGQRKEGLRYLVKEYHAGTDVGGGEFIWNPAAVDAPDDVLVFGVGPSGRFFRITDCVTLLAAGAIPGGDAFAALERISGVMAQKGSSLEYRLSGSFQLSAPVTINGGGANILFDARFETQFHSDYAINFHRFRDCDILGKITVICGPDSTDPATLPLRRQRVGVLISDSRNGGIERVHCVGVTRAGLHVVTVGGNNNMYSVGKVSGFSCGTSSLTADVTSVDNVGATTSNNQYSELTLSAIPDLLEPGDLLRIGDNPQNTRIVMDVIRESGVVRVFPMYTGQRGDQFSGPVQQIVKFGIGSLLHVSGNDANVFGADLVNASRSGPALRLDNSYVNNIGRVHANTCLAAVSETKRKPGGDVMLGINIDAVYVEGSVDAAVVLSADAGRNYNIASGNYNASQVVCLFPSAMTLNGSVMVDGEISAPSGNRPLDARPSTTAPSPRASGVAVYHVARTSTATLTPNLLADNLTGHNSFWISKDQPGYTSVTLDTANSGTINSNAAPVIITDTSPWMLYCVYSRNSNDWRVVKLGGEFV